jgi:hypothetical protein
MASDNIYNNDVGLALLDRKPSQPILAYACNAITLAISYPFRTWFDRSLGLFTVVFAALFILRHAHQMKRWRKAIASYERCQKYKLFDDGSSVGGVR